MGIRWRILLLVFALVSLGSGQCRSDWLDKGKDMVRTVRNTLDGDGSTSSAVLPPEMVARGLKQALEKGSRAVVEQVSARDGFLGDPNIHIPLPDTLNRVAALLEKAGLGRYADPVEERLNRAAEVAAPMAGDLFVSAISKMTLEDAGSILKGANDAATRYFETHMGRELVRKMTPVIGESLGTVGAIQAYDNMLGRYRDLPFVPDVKADLASYTAQRAVEGIFYYLAREEKAIRENPAKRTTELLKKVFN